MFNCVLYEASTTTTGSEWKLLLIGGVRSVGDLPLCGPVYCIQRLIIIPLTTDSSPEILGLEVRIEVTVTVINRACPMKVSYRELNLWVQERCVMIAIGGM